MGWTITATTMTPDGVMKQVYTDEHASNPMYAYGFIAGYACAHGVAPEELLIEFKRDE